MERRRELGYDAAAIERAMALLDIETATGKCIFLGSLDILGFGRGFLCRFPIAFHRLWRSIAEAYLPAYLPILERRKGMPYGERQEAFQLYRRGRYVEFNLLYDRGTRFGLQAAARSESVSVHSHSWVHASSRDSVMVVFFRVSVSSGRSWPSWTRSAPPGIRRRWPGVS